MPSLSSAAPTNKGAGAETTLSDWDAYLNALPHDGPPCPHCESTFTYICHDLKTTPRVAGCDDCMRQFTLPRAKRSRKRS